MVEGIRLSEILYHIFRLGTIERAPQAGLPVLGGNVKGGDRSQRDGGSE
jgi:hypothetical protein